MNDERAKLSYMATGTESGFYLEIDDQLWFFTVCIGFSTIEQRLFASIFDPTTDDVYTVKVGEDMFARLSVPKLGFKVAIDFNQNGSHTVTVI